MLQNQRIYRKIHYNDGLFNEQCGQMAYTDELKLWVSQHKARRLDASAVAFLAVAKDVADAKDAGYSLTTIHEHMRDQKKISFTYETFRRHWKKYQRQPVPVPRIAPVPSTAQDSKVIRRERATASSPVPKFTFDSKPTAEEIF